jgi:molybdate/tungstate transport system substrate-binding protein
VTRPIALGVLGLAALLAGCGQDHSPKLVPPPVTSLRVFHAAGFTPVMDALREPAKGQFIELAAEGSGSQMACRKLTDLGRQCDLVVLADRELVAEMLAGVCSWRLDFAADEMVLAVGARAPNAELAEKDWPAALLAENVKLGRADENLAPVGYRTLLVWKLQERRGSADLCAKLTRKCAKVLDDLGRLTPLLRNGELDYAFVHRSVCVAHGIRFIALDKSVNLGSPEVDYSAAEVSFEKLKAGAKERVTVKGAPICWTLSVPGAYAMNAHGFIVLLFRDWSGVLEKNGLRVMKPPLYYGPAGEFAPFKDFAKNAGPLK